MPFMDIVRSWMGARLNRKSALQQNMEKALRMKQEAGPQTNIPDHVTSHEGGVRGSQVGYTDTAVGKEGTFTENTGRSRGARASDAG